MALEFTNTPILRQNIGLDLLLEVLEEHNAFICGGYARYSLSPSPNPLPANDLDIYCKDKEAFNKLFEYFKVNIGNHKTTKLSETFDPKNSKQKEYKLLPKIQLIKPSDKFISVGKVEDILSNFDFTIAQVALINDDHGIINNHFEYDELNKLLRISNIRCPLAQLMRIDKYRRKGYRLVPGEQIKIFDAWLKIDDNRKQEYRDLAAKIPKDVAEWPDNDDLNNFLELVYIID